MQCGVLGACNLEYWAQAVWSTGRMQCGVLGACSVECWTNSEVLSALLRARFTHWATNTVLPL